MVNACNRNVDVRIVFYKGQREKNFISHAFDGSCVVTRINDSYAIMHDKFIIVDDTTLETGSFNFTEAAEKRNAENVLVLYNAPEIVDGYVKQWEKLWDESE